MPSVLTALLAAGLVLAAHGGRGWLALVVLVVQCVLIVGWFVTVRLPGRIGGLVVALGAAVAADALLLWSADSTSARPLTGLLGLVVVAALLAQLARRDGRPSLTASLTTAVAASAVAVAAATYLSARGGRVGVDVVVVGAVAVGVSGLAFAIPSVLWLRAVIGLVVGTGAGVVAGSASGALGDRDALVVAVVAAFVASAARWGSAQVGDGADVAPVADGPDVAEAADGPDVAGVPVDASQVDTVSSPAGWSTRLFPALMLGALPPALAAVPVFVLGRVLAG